MAERHGGWESPCFSHGWGDFELPLNDLNELVNFYFEVCRPAQSCKDCQGTGLNHGTRRLSEDFYDHACRGTRWCEDITQDEVDALLHEGRLQELYPSREAWITALNGGPRPVITAEQVNRWRQSSNSLGYDALDKHTLVKCRAKRLGIYGICPVCAGRGEVFTGPAQVNLVLWVIYPRKGASCGIEISNIQQEDLPAIFEFLATGAARNAERFARVVAKSSTGGNDEKSSCTP